MNMSAPPTPEKLQFTLNQAQEKSRFNVVMELLNVMRLQINIFFNLVKNKNLHRYFAS